MYAAIDVNFKNYKQNNNIFCEPKFLQAPQGAPGNAVAEHLRHCRPQAGSDRGGGRHAAASRHRIVHAPVRHPLRTSRNTSQGNFARCWVPPDQVFCCFLGDQEGGTSNVQTAKFEYTFKHTLTYFHRLLNFGTVD